MPTCIAHWQASLSSRLFHHTKHPRFRLAGSCAREGALQEFPIGHFRVQPDTIQRTLHCSCPYVVTQSVSGKINSWHHSVFSSSGYCGSTFRSSGYGTSSVCIPAIPSTSHAAQRGSVGVVDSTTFTVRTTIVVADVVVDPGAMRWGSMSAHDRFSDDG